MRRIVLVMIVVITILVGLLVIKLRMQQAALHGPSGGSGEIEGTEISVASKLTARLVETKVKKGAMVHQGDLLATLDCAEPRALMAEAEGRLIVAQAQAKAARAQIIAAHGQQRAANASTLVTQAQAEAILAQRDASRRQAERLDAVANDVAFSNRDQIHASTQGLESQLEAAKASRLVAMDQAHAAAGQARAAVAQAESSEAASTAAQAVLDRAKLLVAECEIRAPHDAWVEEVFYEPGELVTPGAILVKLIDVSEVKAIFYMPNAELAAVRPGTQAQVIADAFPQEIFSGTVSTVSFKAEFTPRNIQTRTDRDRLVYPIEVVVSNPQSKLRPGMPVQVKLTGTER